MKSRDNQRCIMNCSTFDIFLDEYIDGILDADVKSQCEDHIVGCSECSAKVRHTREIKRSLKSMNKLSDQDFAINNEKDFWNAVWEIPTQKEKPLLERMRKGVLSVAVVAIFSFISFYFGIQSGSSQVEEVNFSVMQEKDVFLMFTSEKNESLALFTIEIPDDFDFAGKEGQRIITWSSSLKQGKNLLTLPLVAKTSGSGVLNASVKIGTETQKFKIRLTSKNKA